MFPLAFVGEGKRVVLKYFAGGHGIFRKLVDMGLNPGSEIFVVRNQMAGPLIISVKGGQIALGRGIAMKIYVEVKE